MNTFLHTSRLSAAEERILARQRSTIRRLIDLQPEYFQRDVHPVEGSAGGVVSAGRSGGVMIAFPVPARESCDLTEYGEVRPRPRRFDDAV